ncbi:MAG: SBBP repeat-containing protein [Gammaproteobacteria bacterium]
MRSFSPLALLLLLAACAQEPQILRYDIGAEAARVWPEPPEIPRYRYAGQLTGEANFVAAEPHEPSAGGRFLRWLVGLGEHKIDPLVLLRPQGGIVDPSRQRTYVADVGRQAIFVFDGLQGRLEIWDQAEPHRGFRSPVGVALAEAGGILVTDSELARVFHLDSQGNPLGSFGAGVLTRPTGIARDAGTQRIYVADTAAHDIKVFDNQGNLLQHIGGPGVEPGRFNAPTHLAFAGGRLYVSDTLNARVQVLDAEGQPLREIGKRGLYVGNLTRPKGVTVDTDGNIYVVESYYDHLLVFDGHGELLLPIGGTGKAIGQFYLPAGVWSDAQDRIYVADMFNGRVIILQYLGA